MSGRRRKRILSKEELDLWEYVTRGDTPLAPGARALPEPQQPFAAAQERSRAARRSESFGIGMHAAGPAMRRSHPSSAPAHTGEAFDFRLKRRLARGSRDIDARLDLHGLRQQSAYSALKRFLARAQEHGHRHVLVITGKGGAREESDGGELWRSERGVLRTMVPRWLAEPALSAYVVAFTESAAHHGGSGALYVTVRKRASAPMPGRARTRLG